MKKKLSFPVHYSPRTKTNSVACGQWSFVYHVRDVEEVDCQACLRTLSQRGIPGEPSPIAYRVAHLLT